MALAGIGPDELGQVEREPQGAGQGRPRIRAADQASVVVPPYVEEDHQGEGGHGGQPGQRSPGRSGEGGGLLARAQHPGAGRTSRRGHGFHFPVFLGMHAKLS